MPVTRARFAAVGAQLARRDAASRRFRVAPKASLFLVENSLLGLRKFPVPMPREFSRKPLIELVN